MEVQIKNFRSIQDATVEIAPITLLYGENGSGKSSLFYALQTMKNFLHNPMQEVDGFFNYKFANLGNFEAVVFQHEKHLVIEHCFKSETQNGTISYSFVLEEKKGKFNLATDSDSSPITQSGTFPYHPYSIKQKLTTSGYDIDTHWSGVEARVTNASPELSEEIKGLFEQSLNAPLEYIRRTGIVPLKRGFGKPNYSTVSDTGQLISEEEIASFIANDKYLVGKISNILEEVFNKDFRVHFIPGTSTFSFDVTNKKNGFSTELVNEGFGLNQFIFILAKCLNDYAKIICIEEPEIHLHPSAIRKVAKVFANIAKEQDKRIVLSTHSEHFLTSFLSMVAGSALEPDDLACYHVQKPDKATTFERQKVNDKGQIEGGLSSFLQGELEDLQSLLGIQA